jgi:hypothetical protein
MRSWLASPAEPATRRDRRVERASAPVGNDGAMRLHSNAHEDRVAGRLGRHLLGVDQKLF